MTSESLIHHEALVLGQQHWSWKHTCVDDRHFFVAIAATAVEIQFLPVFVPHLVLHYSIRAQSNSLDGCLRLSGADTSMHTALIHESFNEHSCVV